MTNRRHRTTAVPQALIFDPWAHGNDVKIYALLATHAERPDDSRPGTTSITLAELTELTGWSIETVKRSVYRLAAAGWIHRVRGPISNGPAVTTLNPGKL